jgi:pimeloyl-ACP methyl ester carboxylesterase
MTVQKLNRTDGETLAYTKIEPAANKPTLVWLSGFNSDMSGTKAMAIKVLCENEGYGYMAFDYSGHGESSGDFKEGTITRWREDSLAAIDALTTGPLILIGSSMGGWMALLTALVRKDRVKGMILIAPAPDFTSKLLWPELSGAAQEDIAHNGFWMRPGDYGEPYPITRGLIEDGKKWAILDGPIDLSLPVSILQGKMDPDVPWTHALKVQERIASTDCDFHLIKDGEHRLSRESDILRLICEARLMVERVG